MTLDEADVVIRPHDNSTRTYLRELVQYRGIFWNLFVRALRRQYVDLRLGFLWVFSQPVLMTLIFFLFKKGTGANVETDMPYSLYLLSGFIFWFTWVEACRMTTSADRVNAALISKVFFPRLYSPLAVACSKLLAFLIGLLPILALQAYFGIMPSWTLVLMPVILLQALLLAFAVGLIFAILSIYSADWDRVQGQILYLGLFVSPVIYSVKTIHGAFQKIYSLNPLVGTIEAFRASITGLPFPWYDWGYASAVTLVLLVAAVFVFRRAETRLLDEL